ncbi:MAG: TadA family conjugal transfer-associated ATPase [Nocardioides sp.]
MVSGPISEDSALALDTLVNLVRARLARNPGQLTPHRVADALRAAGSPVGDSTVLAVHERLRRDVLGAGPLEPLLAETGVTDVLVNGPDQVYVDRGDGLELTGVRFPSDDSVRRLAQRLAAAGGRRLDDATPYVDVRLRNGSRCHAVLAPVARSGTSLSLRVPRACAISLDEMERVGTLTCGVRLLLDQLIDARLAFLITGGTGSGKTTLLGAMLSTVPPGERIVIVEDSSELTPVHPHVVRLEARPPNIEGAGELTVRTLVRQALRMRPDRLVVGEVRGGEVVDLMAAMNTGHEGGCGTLHANSAVDVVARVEALALAVGLPRLAAHSQFASAVDVVLHLTRGANGRRRLAELAVPRRTAQGLVGMVSALILTADGDLARGAGYDQLEARLAR